mgnify:CR=1 FL=1
MAALEDNPQPLEALLLDASLAPWQREFRDADGKSAWDTWDEADGPTRGDVAQWIRAWPEGGGPPPVAGAALEGGRAGGESAPRRRRGRGGSPG